MGYTIVYDRKFIKGPKGITTVVLSGSNNTTEFLLSGRERRSRSWGPWYQNPFMSEAELLDLAAKVTYCEFKYRSKWVDAEGFQRFIKNGIKNAFTVEEYAEAGHSLECQLSVYWNDRSYTDRNHYTVELRRCVRTTEEYEQWVEEAQAFVKKAEAESIKKPECYYYIGFYSDNGFAMPANKSLTHECEVCLKTDKTRYVCEIHNSGYTSTVDFSKAIIFKNAEEAREKVDACGFRLNDFHIVKAETVRKKAEACFAIQIAGGTHAKEYVRKLSKRRLSLTYYEDSAKKFFTEASAAKYIREKLGARFPDVPSYEICLLNKVTEV